MYVQCVCCRKREKQKNIVSILLSGGGPPDVFVQIWVSKISVFLVSVLIYFFCDCNIFFTVLPIGKWYRIL